MYFDTASTHLLVLVNLDFLLVPLHPCHLWILEFQEIQEDLIFLLLQELQEGPLCHQFHEGQEVQMVLLFPSRLLILPVPLVQLAPLDQDHPVHPSLQDCLLIP